MKTIAPIRGRIAWITRNLYGPDSSPCVEAEAEFSDLGRLLVGLFTARDGAQFVAAFSRGATGRCRDLVRLEGETANDLLAALSDCRSDPWSAPSKIDESVQRAREQSRTKQNTSRVRARARASERN
jgi:hypothetical protein